MIRLFRILPPALMVLLLLQPLSAAEPKEAKRVLVLYSEDKDHPAHEMTDQGIREAFSLLLIYFLSWVGIWRVILLYEMC